MALHFPPEVWALILNYADDRKLQAWLLNRKDDYIHYLEDQLNRLRRDVERAVTHLIESNELTRLEV